MSVLAGTPRRRALATVLLALACVSLPQAVAAAADSWLARGHWTRLSFEGPMGSRVGALDVIGDRMLLVGGRSGAGADAQTWEYPLGGAPGWRLIRPQGGIPVDRDGHSVVRDGARNRLVMFGGRMGVERTQEVWGLPLAGDPQWEAIPTLGVPPAPRFHHAAIYDPVRDRMILFGGGSDNVTYGDLWELRFEGVPTWAPLTAAGDAPPPLSGAAGIYDPVGDRLVLYSGSQAWSLTLGGSPTWTLLSPAGTPPPTRVGPRAIYDPLGQRMVVHGGSGTNYPGGPSVLRNDAWALSLAGPLEWTQLTPDGAGPAGSGSRTAVHDPARNRMLVAVGGDLWALALDGTPAWSSVHDPVEFPAGGRRWTVGVHDALRNRLLVFGGQKALAAGYENDVWAFSLDSTGWSAITPSGVPPAARVAHVAVFDPVGDRMIVFGGYGGPSQGVLGDLWELKLSPAPAWSPLAASGTPPGKRMYASAAYDPAGLRMLLFGGYDESSVFEDDTWALSLTDAPTWSLLAPDVPGRSAGCCPAIALDRSRNRLILDGALTASFPSEDAGTWELPLSGVPVWSRITVAGEPPEPRYEHTAVVDARRDRLILYGNGGDSFHANPWASSLGQSPEWAKLVPLGGAPPWRWAHAAFADSAGDRMIVFGGDAQPSWLGDVWEHRWTGYGTTVAEQGPANPMVARAAARLAPGVVSTLGLELDSMPGSPGAVPLAFELPTRSRASLVVHDVSGRRVRKLADGAFEAGRHTRTWDRRDDDGRAVPGGIYFASLATDAGRVTRKVVVLP